MKKMKLALIGCCGIAFAAHVPGILEAENIEPVAVCDINRENALKAAKLLSLDESCVYEDYNDVLKIQGLDAIDICTPNFLHSPIAVAALEKGINVFCEKPDAINVAEAEKMRDAAQKSGKVLMVMRNNRFANASKYLKNYIADGKMGDIYTVRCAWRRRRGIPGRGGWFTTKSMSGGGPLIDLGVHGIDLAMWLMGNPKPVAVSASVYNKFANTKVNAVMSEQSKGNTFDVEDLAMGLVRFDNGAVMQIEFSWASNIEKDTFFCELRGDKAGAYWESEKDLKIYGEEYGQLFDMVVKTQNSNSSPHSENIKHFADVVLNNQKPIFTPDQGVDMIKILEAVYKSAEQGKEILL